MLRDSGADCVDTRLPVSSTVMRHAARFMRGYSLRNQETGIRNQGCARYERTGHRNQPSIFTPPRLLIPSPVLIPDSCFLIPSDDSTTTASICAVCGNLSTG